MSSNISKRAMNLRQFLLRQEVLHLYREIFRSIKRVPDESTRKELTEWARTDFRKNMFQNDEYIIKTQLKQGKSSLQTLQQNLALSTLENKPLPVKKLNE